MRQNCLLVRSLLLPGHGSRPADLVSVNRSQWLDALDYGVRSFEKDVDEVWIAGYSLGGLLASRYAAENNNVQGLVLIAPSLQITHSTLAWQSQWLRYIRDWVDIDPQTSALRYPAMPANTIAQLVLLIDDLEDQLENKRGLALPVFMALSADDFSVHGENTLNLVSRWFSNQQNRFFWYGQKADNFPNDPRISVKNTYFPEQKILNFSHVSLTYSPDNPLFGKQGAYKECGLNIGIVDKEQAQLCMQGEDNWKGEVNSSEDPQFLPLQRLNYHPQFDEMTAEIVQFIEQH